MTLRDTRHEYEQARHAAEPLLVAGQAAWNEQSVQICSPYDGHPLALVCQAAARDAETAISAAAGAFEETASLPGWRRAAILHAVADRIAAENEDLARGIALEAGKPMRDARTEVTRAVNTFRVAAEEAKRLGGEVLPLDWTPGTEGRMALIRRVPIGPVLGITPFNFPLNLVAHKVAPAMACGNPIVIKPAPQTPLTALRLGQIVVEAGWPRPAISVLPCANDVAALLLADERLKKLSFTGSAEVGWRLKAAAGKKRVTLELGGNAAVIVHSDADLELAAAKIAQGGFSFSGQSCISVQRVYAHNTRWQTLAQKLVEQVEELVVGDPLDEATQVGPMISEAAAMRAESWINEALERGARLLCGGTRKGAMLQPTVLARVPAGVRLAQEEVFAPVVFVNSYAEFDAAVREVNASRYGLQASVFTRDWARMAESWRRLEVGSVLINESTSWRADHMPYGGVKDSGLGREGLRSAMEAMTEERLLIVEG